MNYLEEKIFSAIDIVEYLVSEYNYRISRRRGNEINGHCLLPNHTDKNASFSINRKSGKWNCYGCGTFGSIFSLIKKIEGFRSHEETLEYLKKKLKIEVSDLDIVQHTLETLGRPKIIQKEKPEFYNIYFDRPYFKPANNYYDIVKKRVNKKMISRWNLKYAIQGYYYGRLIIPIEFDGKIISFIARDMLGQTERWERILARLNKRKTSYKEITNKYYQFGSVKVLLPDLTPIKYIFFNFDEARKKKEVFLVEGPFDVMRLTDWGYNTMAIIGTHISPEKMNLIIENFNKVYLCLDNDLKSNGWNPGQEAALKIKGHLQKFLTVKNIILPKGKDPDECTLEEFQRSVTLCEKLF